MILMPNEKVMNHIFFFCVILSFLSLCVNTPATFCELPWLQYATLAIDIVTGILLTAEVCIKFQDFLKENRRFYSNRWFCFDSLIIVFIWISICIQAWEISEIWGISKANGFNQQGFETCSMNTLESRFERKPLGLFRVARALIILRVFRCSSFQFESGRLTVVVVRAGHQIGGVTIFLLFFLLLYGLLGVQLFGPMSYHCVANGSDLSDENKILQSLAIPDTLCSPEDTHMCPPNFECKNLNLSIKQRGYAGFDNIFVSIKTVNEASSQEGWVFLMYKNIDSYRDWHGYVYFITLVFFLAWLVKNVFIAVIIETFAEIRVQLHNLWGNTRCNHPRNTTHAIYHGDNMGVTFWKWENINQQNIGNDRIEKWRLALRSHYFHSVISVFILLNVVISAFQPHDWSQNKSSWTLFRIAELVFTVIFDVEAVMKVFCLGLRGYFRRKIYQYEAFLALMTTITAFHSFHPAFQCLPVLRIIRLVEISPTLENFIYKIFSPVKKIGILITFTIGILTLMAAISLQILCYSGDEDFSTIMQAVMSMFQIMTQEGWIDVMTDAMNAVGPKADIFISIYFTLYHLFVTTVMISLFVAVILDNLELDENLKCVKQLKVNEQSVDIKNTLRLRIFELFPNQPEMVKLSKISGDFSVPHLRSSFLKEFVELPTPLVGYVSAGSANSHQTSSPTPFSPSSGIIASTTLATRLAAQKDGLTGWVKENRLLEERCFVETATKRNFWNRFNWRRYTSNSANPDVKNDQPYQNKDDPKSFITRPALLWLLMCDCRQQAVTPEKSLLSISSLSRRKRRAPQRNRQTFDVAKERQGNDINTPDAVYNRNPQQEVDFKLIHVKRQQAILMRKRQEEELRENHPYFDTPLLIISRDSKIRKFCKVLVNAQYKKQEKVGAREARKQIHFKVFHDLLGLVPYIDWVMILVTVGTCFSMMLESTTNSLHNNIHFQIVEFVFCITMGIELILKVCANGAIFTPNPTFEDLGGILDAVIFLDALILVCTLHSVSSIGHSSRLLMLLRCLRPLRIFKQVPQIKKVVQELFQGFVEIMMVFILLVALMFVFATFGVQVYGGRLGFCNDFTIENKEDCTGIFKQRVWVSNSLNLEESDALGFMVPRVWTNPRNFNFDTIFDAMLTLFEVLSLKGWVEVRDILVKRMGWIHNLYIHIYVFLGCMIGLPLFIGVVIANYNENKGTALLTVDQRRWEDLKSRLKIAQPLHLPPRPTDHFKAKIYDLIERHIFKFVAACCVLLQSLLLCFKWESSSNDAVYLVYISFIFTFIFTVEIILKIIGMSFKGMLSSWRNRYDLVVTISQVIWSIIYVSCSACSSSDTFYSMGWTLVAFRFCSICGKHAALKMLLMTVAVSVYRSFFIIIAVFLLLFSYSFAGVVLFGRVKYGENINRHANFATASLAMTVLFRIVTGEDWNKIMHDCMIQPPRCTPSDDYLNTDCGNVTAALIYFISFYIIIAYIMLNILVAIIVENFSLFYTMDEDILLSYNDLHMFQVTWNTIDVKRKGEISVDSVEKLLKLLKGSLHIEAKTGERHYTLLKHMRYEMEKLGHHCTTGNISGRNGSTRHQDDTLYVTFHDVLTMIAYRSVNIRKSLQLEELLMREKLEAEIEEEVAKQCIRMWLEKCIVEFKKKSRIEVVKLPPAIVMTDESVNEQNVELKVTVKEINRDLPDTSRSNRIKVEKSRRHGQAGTRMFFPALSPTDERHDENESYKTSAVRSEPPVAVLDKWWMNCVNDLEEK